MTPATGNREREQATNPVRFYLYVGTSKGAAPVRRNFNGLKTAALFGVLWAVLWGVGGVIAAGTRSAAPLWIFALIGVGTTAYGYWNSGKIAIRSM